MDYFFFSLFLLLSLARGLAPCDPNVCKIENDCLCPSRTVPVNINPEDVPQFVLFTMDDSIDESQFDVVQRFDFLLKNLELKDAKGCTPKMSFYALETSKKIKQI